jgi:hypothetical protein
MTATRHQPQPVTTAHDNDVQAVQQLHPPTRAEQRTARIMGAWFLGTFVFSIPAFWFYNPLLNHARYILGNGQDTRVAVGALLEICLATCGIATAVVIYPIVKKVSASTALGYVAARTVESMLILVGVLSLMSIVALRHDATTGDTHSGLADAARGLLALHAQVSLLGPQFLRRPLQRHPARLPDVAFPAAPTPDGDVRPHRRSTRPARRRRRAAGRMGHPRRTSCRDDRARDDLGVLAERVAARPRFPAIPGAHRRAVGMIEPPRRGSGLAPPNTIQLKVIDS